MAVLSLFQSSPEKQHDEILDFIAIFCDNEKLHDALQNLSPKTMPWQNNLWLIDMRACQDFWLYKAKQKNLDISACINQQLKEIFGDEEFYASASPTPWEAILLLKAAREKGFPGMIHFTSRLGKNLLSGLSWDLWWEACSEYACVKNIPDAMVNKARHAMSIAMKRLGCQRPEQFRTLPSPQIRRRFGALVADVWQLSFPERQGLKTVDAIHFFPWTSYVTTHKPFVKRHLDHELREWNSIEELLREDLNRLCVLGSFKKEERILNLEWRIVLCNLQVFPINILFRHPHSLHQDCPSQRTALLQINYAFDKIFSSKASSAETGLISWQLEIVEKAPARLRQGSLFHESSDDLQSLQQLENMIKKPLESFALSNDWLAEDSYSKGGEASDSSVFENYLPLAAKRPLFLYPDAPRFSSDRHTRVGHFQERTMDKWWKSSNRSRDYYQMIQDETMLWVYRDQEGSWFTQGIYG
jgi:hypothetical protein